jgi:MFS transporter, PAT family, beta-lactamase induction signal transducer AmpG
MTPQNRYAIIKNKRVYIAMTLTQFKIPRRLWIILFQGFASGLPLALVSSTLSAWYTEAGVSIMGIGLLSLIGQPYIYKFIWAPLFDRFDPLGLGRRRSWMLITQVFLILGLLCIAQLNPLENPVLLPSLALLVAFFSASQDIPISAYFTEAAGEHERGIAASFMTIGYRVAFIITTAMALIMAEYWGWRLTYSCMAALMGIGLISTWFTPHLPYHETHTRSFKETLFDPFKDLWQRLGLKYFALIFILLITYKLTDALALALNSMFLLRVMHFSLAEVGTINKLFGFAAVIVGSLAGGFWMKRLSLFRALLIFGFLQAFANIAYLWLYHSGPDAEVLAITVIVSNFFNGMGNIAFLALVMRLCNKEFTGTQYALLSALTAVGPVYVGPLAALLATHLGWNWYYSICVVVGFLVLGLLPLVKKVIAEH